MNARRQLEILSALCDLPTTPYLEGHVIGWLLAWAAGRKEIRVRRDGAGNVYLEYRRGRAGGGGGGPMVLEAHMDHPGFVAGKTKKGGVVEARFFGGVRPSHFAGARMRFWVGEEGAGERRKGEYLPRGHWVAGRVQEVKQAKKGGGGLSVRIGGVKEAVPAGSLGMWDLPEAEAGAGGQFAARVCDDLAGVAAIVCVLEELMVQRVEGHVIGLLTRAEEVGFAGVLAVCENGWLPRESRIIGLETSKASGSGAGGGAVQGGGAVIRVGDKSGLFSPGLTHFLAQAAGHLADEDRDFRFQRKLMDGGTCSSTAFVAWGYDAAAICLALGNYHNMTVKGEPGWRAGVGGKAGPGIASETIDLGDFDGMVRILVEAAKRFKGGKGYKPGFGVMRERLAKLHREEQMERLYRER